MRQAGGVLANGLREHLEKTLAEHDLPFGSAGLVRGCESEAVPTVRGLRLSSETAAAVTVP
jgi:hypothetical protein